MRSDRIKSAIIFAAWPELKIYKSRLSKEQLFFNSKLWLIILQCHNLIIIVGSSDSHSELIMFPLNLNSNLLYKKGSTWTVSFPVVICQCSHISVLIAAQNRPICDCFF